jgi:hypothetical protein
MEQVYTYGIDAEKTMKNLLDQDFFKRLGPTVRECKAMGLDMDGFCFYIKARDDLVEEAEKLLKDSPAKELKGDHGEKLLQAFRDESESAEAGMGALFG